jgi:alpha-beta hydrolase superfamily lysophospholipase
MVTHRFDNDARITELETRGPGNIVILHGTDDEVIPVTMSRQLAAKHGGIIRLVEIPGGRHNTLQDENASDVSRALKEMAK